MTSHELARALLALPDLLIYKTTPEGLMQVTEASKIIVDLWVRPGTTYGTAHEEFYPEFGPEADEIRMSAIKI